MKQSQEFGYIHHTVAFSLKWDKGSQQEKDFLEKSYDILILVPNVENFAIRKQISKKNDFDYELTMDFESEEKYEEYNNHPDHQGYVKNIWLKQTKNFLEKDTIVLMETPKTKTKENGIRHSVAFKLKWDKGSFEEQKFLEDSFNILINVPNVKNFEVNKQTNANNPYDYELAMDFDNQKEYGE